MCESGRNRGCVPPVLSGGVKQNGKDADRTTGTCEEIELKDALKISRGILDRYERGMLLAEAARIAEKDRCKAQEEK